MWIKLLASLFLMTVISSSISLLFSNDVISFIKYFTSFSIIQIIIHNLYKKYLEISLEKIKNDRIKEYSKQGMEVKCPCYLEKTFFIPINLNQNNTFNCNECKKNVSVEINTKTFIETEIINLDAAEIALQEVYKKIKE